MDYWKDLLPLDVRWSKNWPASVELGRSSLDEAVKMGLISEEDFSSEIDNLWKELKAKLSGAQRMLYWDFIGSDTYQKTISRAMLTGFLVSYGYARLYVDRIEEEIYIAAYEDQIVGPPQNSTSSVPVLVDYEEWRKWSEKKGK